MTPDFVRQNAPRLASMVNLKPRTGDIGWVTQEAGMTPPDAMYSEQTDMPLPYIQEQGGPRQFYVPEGETATNLTPLQPPIQGLRGTMANDFPMAQAPEQPMNLMRPRPAPTPPGPIAGLRGLTEDTTPGGPYLGPRATARIPPPPGGGQGVTYPNQRVTAPIPPAANQSTSAPPAATPNNAVYTLGELMRSLNIQLPNIRLPSSNNRGNTPRQSSYVVEDGVVPPEQFDPRTGAADYLNATENERRIQEQERSRQGRQNARQTLPIRNR